MTKRLYYTDSYLTEFQAIVVGVRPDGKAVYLNETAFYPPSGGQPQDAGTLNGVAVLNVVDEGDRIAHETAEPVALDTPVVGVIDWQRRFDLMQQHTGQHLLSAVLESLCGWKTVSVHFGDQSSTVDVAAPAVDSQILERVETRANQLIVENRPVSVTFVDAQQADGLRKATDRTGDLRIVSIADLDRSACGGTHVRQTGEIGPLLIRKVEKIRSDWRIEFLCGHRAVRQARRDYEALLRVARVFSSTLEDVPALVESQAEQHRESEKTRRKLAADLAQRLGREAYAAAAEDAQGRRVYVLDQSGPLGDDVRIMAQSYTAQPKAVFLALSENPMSVLYAVSTDSGLHAGNLLKAALQAVGGRGGGSAQLGQGSVPDAASLRSLRTQLAG